MIKAPVKNTARAKAIVIGAGLASILVARFLPTELATLQRGTGPARRGRLLHGRRDRGSEAEGRWSVTRALVCLVLLSACSPSTTETAVESGMKSGMIACEVLLQDPSIERTPEAEEWCRRVVHGCPK